MATTAKVTLADLLAKELKEIGLGAGPAENNLAVRAVNPDTGRATLIWLPEAEVWNEGYIWGPFFQFGAPPELTPERVAEMVKTSAVHW